MAGLGHLRKKKEFEAVFKAGRSSYDQLLGCKALRPENSSELRFGIIVSNKVSKRAVLRNRLRRQIRYLFHKHAASFIAGIDVVILVMPAALGQPFASLEKSFLNNLKRARACQ